MEITVPRAALVVLSLAGLAISVLFVAATYNARLISSRWIPSFCRMEEGSCRSVTRTRQGNLFGIPNAAAGAGYYTLVLLAALVPGWLAAYGSLLLAASAGTVVLSGYLAYALLVQLKVSCVLCFTSHIINVVLFLILLRIA
jgi:uncharacterized membrane protein